MKAITEQEQLFMMGVEMVDILETTTDARFEQYKADFLNHAEGRPTVSTFLQTVFDLAEQHRMQKQ